MEIIGCLFEWSVCEGQSNGVEGWGGWGWGSVCVHACIEKALNGGTDNESADSGVHLRHVVLNSGVLLSNIAND